MMFASDNSIQLKNVKKEISEADDKIDNSMSSSMLTGNQTNYSISIKTDEAEAQLLSNSSDGIISDRSNIKNICKINLNQLSTPIIKPELVFIKCEPFDISDSTSETPNFETNFISVKDEYYDGSSGSEDDTHEAHLTESQTNPCGISSTDSLSEETLKRHCEKKKFPHYGLFVAGSTLNRFGLKNSDIDFSILDTRVSSTDKHLAVYSLNSLSTYLKQYKYINHTTVIKANVPIIRFRESQYNINVDMNYNHITNIRNTYLLFCYSLVDWRVQPLVVIIKLWAESQKINNPMHGTISSYTWTLMVIHFLQFGVKPAVLPCLQNMYPHLFDPNRDVRDIDFSKFDHLKSLFNNLQIQNDQSLGELFVGFFKYYHNFDFENSIISIRQGVRKPIICVNGHMKNFYMYVEEPFGITNTSPCVRYDGTRQDCFNSIKRSIRTTYLKLILRTNFNSILVNLSY